MINPLQPIPGVPDDLIRSLNDRFRQITTSTGAKATAGGRQTRIQDFPAAKQAPGDFFVEMDRGNALYQMQAGQWLLVTGSIVGLDANRPADLGVSDTGFLYRSTDTGREFRWSGSAWVDVTAVPAVNLHSQFYTARSSSIGTVTVSAVPAGRYLFCVDLGATTSGAGTVTWTFSWVSGGVTRTITSGAVTLTVALATSGLTATYPINVDGGTNVTYATTYAGPGSYEFTAVLHVL